MADYTINTKRQVESETESLHRVQSWETAPHDEEEKGEEPHNAEMRFQLADLEKALETSRGEQRKMAKELQKMRLGQGSQQQESRLLQEDMARLKLDHEQELHTLRTKIEEQSKLAEYWSKKHQIALTDLHDLKERWIERDEMWKHEWERKAAEVLEERDGLREQLHTMQKIAQTRGEDAEEAKRQLLDLKQDISSSTRIQTQVTDHEFAEMMSALNHEIQNWIVHTFRKSKNSMLCWSAPVLCCIYPLISQISQISQLLYTIR